jgi:hypothetical protein
MSSVLAVPHARDQLHGWCAACYAAGDFTPAVDVGLQACGPHLRLLPRRPAPAGQLQLQVDVAVVPAALRARYGTGEQQWCADCVAAALAEPRLGLAERTAGDPTPLCMTCWRSRSGRARRGRRRGLSPEQAGWVADLQVRLACEACSLVFVTALAGTRGPRAASPGLSWGFVRPALAFALGDGMGGVS